MMNYAGIKYCDVANGPGCRTVLFVSGCRNACRGCFQPQTWDFCYGEPFDEAVQKKVLASLEPDYVQGITLLGGEPFEEENQDALLPFIRTLRQQYPKKDIWAFTGYVYDTDLVEGGRKYTQDTGELLSLIDVLVDGPFREEQKDLMLKFRGSSNQRVIDLKKTLEQGKLVLMYE
jgi:anaerobic ribonucleoside-triphosphate reductase activating protein